MKDGISNVEIGQSLPRETWLDARDKLEGIFVALGDALFQSDYKGKGTPKRDELISIGQLAFQAMTYVAEFATDKCRIIVLPDKDGGDDGA